MDEYKKYRECPLCKTNKFIYDSMSYAVNSNKKPTQVIYACLNCCYVEVYRPLSKEKLKDDAIMQRKYLTARYIEQRYYKKIELPL